MAINSTLTDYALSGLPNIKADLGLENKPQTDARLFAAGQAAGQPFEDYRPGLKAIAQGAAQNIPSIIDNVRKLGVEKGLPMQTKSELFDQALQGYDGTPGSQIRTIQSLMAIDPSWGGVMAQRMQQQNEETQLRQLQMENLENQNLAAEQTRLQQAKDNNRLELEREGQRGAMMDFVRLAQLDPAETQAYLDAIGTGKLDQSGLETLLPLLDTTDDLRVVGNAVKNFTTGEWDLPPKKDEQTGELMIDVSPKDFEPSSIAAYRRAFNNATTPEERDKAADLLLPIVDGYRWVKRTDEIDGQTVITDVNVPFTMQARTEARAELEAMNSRNRTLNRQSNQALTKIREIQDAVESGESSVGALDDILFTKLPGSNQWTLATNIETVNAVLGLTALADARNGYATGASGFGQLTAAELRVLTNQIAALDVGLSQEAFLNNLGLIEQAFAESARRSSREVTMPQFIGMEDLPDLPETEDF